MNQSRSGSASWSASCSGAARSPRVDDLRAQVLAFIAYYNRTMAKPFKWTYQGKALAAESAEAIDAKLY